MENFFKGTKKAMVGAGILVAPFIVHGQEKNVDNNENMSDKDKVAFTETANKETHNLYAQDGKLVVKTVESDKKTALNLYDGKSKETTFKIIKFDGGSPDPESNDIHVENINLSNSLSADVLYQIGRGTDSSPEWVVSQMEKNSPGSGRLAVIGLKTQLENINKIQVPGLKEEKRHITGDELNSEKQNLQKEIDDLIGALEAMGL